MPEKKRVPVPERPPEDRIKDFREVPLGYNEEQALKENKSMFATYADC